MKLVIAEKPSVARTIAEVLGAKESKNGYLEGNGYYVSWCVGHLVSLCNADTYDSRYKKWSYEDLPIIPREWQHRVLENTQDQYETLERLLNLNSVSEVICATDAGREGELIFRLVYYMAKCNKPIKRLWISSMEESAIVEGFDNLKDGVEYDNLYYSALCRSEADWLVGINATRLFTTLYRKKLNVGRVQTPTLAMLVDRESKIMDFQKEQYYIAHILFNGIDASTKRIDNKLKAEQIMRACLNGQALVASMVQEEKSINPPKLYDLTTLQREANRLYGYTAKQTLDYTQSLYEKKLVTYPRTDSQFLTEDMGATTEDIIHTIIEYLPFAKDISYIPNVDRVLNSKKVSDHHAIIPTKEIAKQNLSSVPGTEKNILNLIAHKLLCATGEKQVVETVKAVFECGGEQFFANGKAIKSLGWKQFENAFKSSQNTKEEKDSKEVTLPILEQGMKFEKVQTKVSEHFTSPPKHFTEDALLHAMECAGSEDTTDEAERKGLGTPATRAAIIEKLVDSGFMERNKKNLIPTRDGINLITVMPDIVKSPKLTAEWENALTLVAKGEETRDCFMGGIRKMVTDLVQTYHEVGEEGKALFQSEREVIGICPKCGGTIYESKVNFYCENRECKFSLFKENKYFMSMKKTITKGIATDLIKYGRAKVKGLYSKNKDKTFDAIIVMNVTGDYVQFSMEFEPKKKKKYK